MPKNYYAAAWLMLGTLAASTASAQQARPAQRVLAADGQPEFVQLSPEAQAASRSADVLTVLREQLALGANDQMLFQRAETDELGFTHQKFAQFYKGIRVEHAAYTVHAKNGAVQSLSGDFERIGELSVRPSLPADQALRAALAHVGASRYMWQDAAAEADLKASTGNPAATYHPSGELVVVRDARGGETGPLVLAWKFNVYAQQPVSRAYIYVDAATGQVVLQDNIIKHAAATATFATAYSGTRSLANSTATGGYNLRETTRGLGIETYNCRKSNSYTAAVDFIDADNNWTAAEYNNANYDNVAGDAHFGAQATYDYWKNVHNRNSYDNAGAKIKSYVHFDDVPGGAGYENAFWDGVRMTYGDGASTFKPLAALDVCGHEIGHAVCENTCNLTYQNESGAMNEGFSDIWGACVEARAVSTYSLSGKSTWLIGEEIMKAGGALRSMSNPNAYSQPDTYQGTYWRATTTSPTQSNDYGGVHTNSGVLNFWFYLLSQGGSGTNDIGSAYSVAGIGIDAAARIAYRAESVYLSASSTYSSARTASINAATDLYGAGSAQVTAVTNAWYAVGVGAAAGGGGGTTTPTYCASKGNSVSYEYIDYVALNSMTRSSGADAGYYNGTASYNANVTAGSSYTLSLSAGFTGTAYSEYVKVYADWNQDGTFGTGETWVSAAASSSAATRSFTVTVPSTAKNGKTRLRVVMSDASATTACGTFSYGETEDYSITVSGGAALVPNGIVAGSSQRLEVYPNPATDHLRLLLPDSATPVRVTVSDLRGVQIDGLRYADGQLDVSTLAKGMYTLSVNDGKQTYHQRFLKE